MFIHEDNATEPLYAAFVNAMNDHIRAQPFALDLFFYHQQNVDFKYTYCAS